MRKLFVPFLLYLVIKIILLAIAGGVGFLLHWLIPSIDTGMALLIGLVLTGMTFHFFSRLLSTLQTYQEDNDLFVPEEFFTPPMPVVSSPTPRRGRPRR